MTEPDPLREAIARARAIPRDVVPPTVPSRLSLTPGDEVVVSIPGEVLTDADGVPIGVAPTEHMSMTVTDGGALVGWVTPPTDPTSAT